MAVASVAPKQYEIIHASEEEGGVNLYSPRYGDEFVGNFISIGAACCYAVQTNDGPVLIGMAQ